VKLWNSLPEEVVTASSVKVFENRLDTFWKDQPAKYNFREELRTWFNDLGKEDNCILRSEHTDDDDDNNDGDDDDIAL